MLPDILNSLQTIRDDNNFSPAAVTTFSETTTNQLSSCVKVKITENSRDLHLFIKFLDTSQHYYDFYDESVIYFRNEIVFYKEIVSHFLPSSEDQARLTCLAKCYATSSTDNESSALFIVLEDLEAKGYFSLNTREPLTADSLQVVVRQLAWLHAHSMALKRRQPGELTKTAGRLQETVFRRDKRHLFTSAIHDAYRLAKKSFPADSVYVDRLEGFVLNVFDKLSHLVSGEDEEDEEWKVVTHGDLWLNSMLCKRDPDSGVICDPVFVDFQGCRYSSPVHDLALLLLTGLEREELERHGQRLVRCYRDTLEEALGRLGWPHAAPPSRRDALDRQMARHAQVALGTALAGLPVLLRDEGDRKARCRDLGSLDAFLRRLREEKTLRCKNRMLDLIIYAVHNMYI